MTHGTPIDPPPPSTTCEGRIGNSEAHSICGKPAVDFGNGVSLCEQHSLRRAKKRGVKVIYVAVEERSK